MKAAIDIGTNTVLLLVAEMQNGRVGVIDEQQEAPRLGKGVDRDKNISAEAMERVIGVIEKYKRYLEFHFPEIEEISVTATSAVRDAENGTQFLNKIKRNTGLEVNVLSGVEEARYTYKGALSVLGGTVGSSRNVVLDIGGGSTEVAIGESNKLATRHSFDMGCVRFTERYLKSDPVMEGEVERCRGEVEKELESHPLSISDVDQLIGVAGTATSLAYIDLGLDAYEGDKINGCELTLLQLKNYIGEIRQIRSDELAERYPEVMKGRADIFLAGLLILEGFMDHYNFSKYNVSTGGVRHGAILESQKK